jgi:chromosome partitioning protein
MIISVLNQKGGTGKTTLSVNIARSMTIRGKKTILIDSDPQGSASCWHAKNEGNLLDLVVLSNSTFEKDVLKFKKFYDVIIIDGISRTSNLTINAITSSDIILIPVQPSTYDVDSTKDILVPIKDRITITNNVLKAAFIISRRLPNTRIGKRMINKINMMGLPVFENMTSNKIAYLESTEDGVSVLDGLYTKTIASREIENITNELEEFCYGIN